MHNKQRHFIFGYGSLISAISRAKTGETGQVWPAVLSGYQRHWSIMTTEFGMSSVAVVQDETGSCNGVLIEVEEKEFAVFDEREQGYQRALIPQEQLHSYIGHELPEGNVWIYYSQDIVNPTNDCPITLSYLDVILAGCLDFGDAFLNDFLTMTKGWQHPLINDRQTPRYPRVQTELETSTFVSLLAATTRLNKQTFMETYDA